MNTLSSTNKRNYFFLLLIPAFILAGCGEDETKPNGQYEQGVFIVNEGSFGSGNGTITHYIPDTKTDEQNIFISTAGDFAGDVAQSLTFHDGKGFIVLNGDNKIEVVNGNTFASVSTIADVLIDKPRYVEVINNKAYISVWGAYDEFFSLVDSYVLVYDLESEEVITTIDTDEGTENLLYDGNRLFASNFNYGASSTVAVINPATNALVDHIDVEAGPAGMVLDANGKLWVVCVGAWGAETGQLFRINPATLAVEEEITITGVPGMDIAVTPDKQHILYSVGNVIYSIALTATQEADEELFEATGVVSLYALNVDPDTGNIYIGDAPSFSAPGKVYVYSSTGTAVDSFDAGIGPGQIVFK